MKILGQVVLLITIFLLLPSSVFALYETRFTLESYQVQTGVKKVTKTITVKESCQVKVSDKPIYETRYRAVQKKVGDRPIYETRYRSVYAGQVPVYGWVCNYGATGTYSCNCRPCGYKNRSRCCSTCSSYGCRGGQGVVGSRAVYRTESYQALVRYEPVYATVQEAYQVLVRYEPVYETRVCDVQKTVTVDEPVYETRYKQVATQVEISKGSASSARSSAASSSSAKSSSSATSSSSTGSGTSTSGGSSSTTITRCY